MTWSPVVTVDLLEVDDTTPVLTGTVDDPDADIEVVVNDRTYPAINNADGTWILPDNTISPALAIGTYDVAATATDPAGNQSSDTTTDELIVLSDEPLLRVTAVGPTDTGVSTAFNYQIDVNVLNLYDTHDGTYGAADLTVVGQTVGPVAGSLLYDPQTRRVTFVKTGGPLVPDTYALTLRGAEDGFTDSQGNPLDGDGDATPGGDYVTTFVVEASDARLVSLPDFTRGPGQEVNIPATTSGIPITISDGTDVQSVDFLFEYDPALLDVSRIVRGSAVPGEWRVVYDMSTPGRIPVTFYGTSTTLPASQVRILDIEATIPDDAEYAATAVLSLTNLQLNEGAIEATADSGIEVVAYIGDVTGNYSYSGLDASYIARVSVGLGNGFGAAYRLKDPVLVGDVNGNGRLTGLDASYIARKSVGFDIPAIPDLPGVLQGPIVSGPDPLLSIADDLTAYRGDTFAAPVWLDMTVDNPFSEELEAGYIVLQFDPAVFALNDVLLGELIDNGDWDMYANIDNAAGLARITFYTVGSTVGNDAQGAVLELNLTALELAPTGATGLDMVESLVHEGLEYRTDLNDGWLTLTIEDGVVTILAENAAPVATNDAITVTEDEARIISMSELLDNDSDPDLSDTLSIASINTAETRGTLTDNGDHTYTFDPRGHFDELSDGETATFIFTYTVSDDRGGEAVATVTITVNGVNDAPEVTSLEVTPDPVSENGEITLEGTFTDPDSSGAFVVTVVDWGDGSAPDISILPPGSTDFSIPHTYLDDDPSAISSDPYTIRVTVEDDTGEIATEQTQVAVTNIAPTLSGVSATDVDEGSITTLTGTITDPGTLDTFTLSVNWDDGTPVDFFSYPAGTTVFSETHVYTNDGEYTIAVTVEDDDLGQDLTDTIVTITNVAPATDAGGPYEIDEGDDLPVSATASDPSPADQGILVYEWDFDSDGFYDDGVGANTTVPWATLAALGLGDDGVYTIGLQVSDDDSSTDSSTTLAINNVSPTVDLGPDITVDEGDDVSINASFSDPGSLDTHSATLQVHGVFTVSVTIIADTTVYEFVATDDGLITVSATIIADTAIYEFVATDDGVFTVTVQVSDDDGGVGSDDLILTINNVPPTADAGGPYEIDEGDDLALAGSGSDVGPVDAAILTYRWDLNDDNSFNDAVSAAPTVPWADLLTLGLGSGVHTITLRVFDDDTSTDDSTTLTISAANTAPVLDAVGDQEVDEETLLAFTATASDADLPAQSLTFSLSGAPAGASIDPITGVFNWTPTEAQGPGEYHGCLQLDTDRSPRAGRVHLRRGCQRWGRK